MYKVKTKYGNGRMKSYLVVEVNGEAVKYTDGIITAHWATSLKENAAKLCQWLNDNHWEGILSVNHLNQIF